MDGFALPVKKLKGTDPIETLDLSGKNLGVSSAVVIAFLIGVNGALTRVDISKNFAGDGAEQLSAAVLGNLKIEMFNEIPIKEMRANSLMELDLNGKGVGVEGVMVVAGLIPVMGALTSISLANNMISGIGGQYSDGSGDLRGAFSIEGIAALADALSKSMTLRSVDLSNNSLAGVNRSGHGTFRPEGINLIADAIRVNGGLTSLDLSKNALCGVVQSFGGGVRGTYTAEGITAIANALRVNGALTMLSLAKNRLGEEGTKAICEALEQNKTLKELDISGHYGSNYGSNIGGSTGAKHVAKMLGVNGGLTALNLSTNRLLDEGVSAVCEAIQSNKETKLSSLNFKDNGIGPVGAKSVAAMVAVICTLTECNLRSNSSMGEEAQASIRNAVQGKAWFKLRL